MVTKMKVQRRGWKSAAILAVMALLFAAAEALAASTWLSSISCDVPTRIALDAQGNIYVTEARGKNLMLEFDRRGNLLRTLPGLANPAGVAVDGQGRIYIASFLKDSVDVYNADFTYSFSLGAGNGEFSAPHSIVIAASGLIYVSDSGANKIKVYNANGGNGANSTLAFTFGGFGQGTGQFNHPLGMAINESRGELYVLDWGITTAASDTGGTAGARVQVFDLQGGFIRSWGQYGTGPGLLQRPLDLALDRDGRVYVADGFQGVIEVFDPYGVYAETIFDVNHPTKTPIAVAVGKDNRVFIASNNQKNVEVFGMTGYTTMDEIQRSLAFTAVAGGGNPASQTVTITNSGSGTLDWTATADRGWITPTKTDAATLTVGINTAGMAAGAYSGTITITASTGATDTVSVQLTVTPPPAVLTITPQGLAFKAQSNGPAPLAQTIDIRNTGGGTMVWTAAKSQPWLSLNVTSGTAAPSSQILASITTALPVGTYSDIVTITAPGATNSPAAIGISFTVTNTGTLTVASNLSQTQFTITGPAPATTSQSGSGSLWTSDNMAPGDYALSFSHVTGYLNLPARTVTITTGKETAVQADYAKKAVMTHLVAVTGDATGKKVTVMTVAGDQVSSFKPFDHPVSDVRAAVGDLDKSGTDKIVVIDNNRNIKVFGVDGTQLAQFTLDKSVQNASLAVGDIDNDGKAEILLGTVVSRLKKHGMRSIEVLAYSAGQLTKRATPLYTEDADGQYNLAVGDLNGDALPEVVLADQNGVRAFSITNGSLVQLWAVQGTFAETPEVATGDVNDDGASEVILSRSGIVTVFKGTGEPTDVMIATPKAKVKPSPASVAAGDVDGDGIDEIAVGSADPTTGAVAVQYYKGDGSPSGTAIPVPNAVGPDVNISLGRM